MTLTAAFASATGTHCMNESFSLIGSVYDSTKGLTTLVKIGSSRLQDKIQVIVMSLGTNMIQIMKFLCLDMNR